MCLDFWTLLIRAFEVQWTLEGWTPHGARRTSDWLRKDIHDGPTSGPRRQLRDLKAADCRKVFSEQVSSVAARAQLDAALDYCREGDTLVVTKLDRLARSARHLSELVDAIEAKGVTLRILNFGGDAVDTRGATGRLVLNMFAADGPVRARDDARATT